MGKITGLFAALDISATGLAAQRRRMNTIAENLANTNTTHTKEGGPYKRKIVRFFEMHRKALLRTAVGGGGDGLQLKATSAGHMRDDFNIGARREFSGVRIDVVDDKAEPERVYDPDHPDADETGYVKMPKIDVIVEMVDMIAAARAYEANVTAIKTAKDMARKALEI